MARRLDEVLKQMGVDTSGASTPTSSTTDTCTICGNRALCGNTGMVRYDVPVDDPRFGKMYRCPYHDKSLDAERQQTLRSISNLDAFADKQFHNFQVDFPMLAPSQEQSLRLAHELSQKMADEPDGWLLLEGTYGCGKTHLAAAIGNARLAEGDIVIFVTAPDLLDHLRSAYAPNAESNYDETFNRLRQADMLIVDDLGVENPSEWAKEKLFQLLNYRYNYRLPTVITTNMDIERFDPRIRSRLLHEGHTQRVRIIAPDYRSPVVTEGEHRLSNLAIYSDLTFENFTIDRRNLYPKEEHNLERAFDVARAYAQDPQGWLVLGGHAGTGKTHLAAAIALTCRDYHKMQVMLVTVPDLLDYLRDTYAPTTQTTFDKRFDAVRRAELLVLDNLGTENATPWAKEKLFQIIDYRYVAKLPTVITTTKIMDEIDQRVAVRLLDDRVCHYFGLDVEAYTLRRRRK